jgi:hypothetical protein
MSASPSHASAPPSRPWRNALEGAAAALCAVIAMAAVAAFALALLDPGSAGSLWSLTMAVTALAVGGSLNLGPDTMPVPPAAAQGAGLPSGASLTTSGAINLVPLTVTLVGAVVLWLVFSRRLRQRTFDARELAARVGGALTAALLALLGAAVLAHGSISLPAPSAGKAGGIGSLGGKLGELAVKLFGSGGVAAGGAPGGAGAAAQPPMTYDAQVGATVLGALVWVVVVLALGLVISRRVPAGFTAGGLRASWAPSASPIVRTLLVVVALMSIGALAGVGNMKAAGGALLVTPLALATVLSLGLGSTWTSSSHQVQSQGGTPPAGQQPTSPPPDHTQHVGDLTAGGLPVWIVALVVTGLFLLACAYAAARATDPAHARPLHPYRGPMARHLGLAERFGIVTAVVLGGAAWLAQTSFHVGVSMAGHAVGGSEMRLGGGVLWTVVAGLLAGAVAGFAGSLLQGERTPSFRFFPRRSPAAAVGGRPVSSNTMEPGA